MKTSCKTIIVLSFMLSAGLVLFGCKPDDPVMDVSLETKSYFKAISEGKKDAKQGATFLLKYHGEAPNYQKYLVFTEWVKNNRSLAIAVLREIPQEKRSDLFNLLISVQEGNVADREIIENVIAEAQQGAFQSPP